MMILARSFYVVLALHLCSISRIQAQSNEDDVLLDFYSYAPCNICGADDGVIGNGDAILPEGTGGIVQEELTCSDLQAVASAGRLSPASCVLLPYVVYEACECMSSGPAPVFPPLKDEESTFTTTVLITLEGISDELEDEDLDIFEQVCEVFLQSEIGGVRDLSCSVQGQSITEEGSTQLEVLVGGVVDEVESGINTDSEFGSLVVTVLTDGSDAFIDQLQDASDSFDGVSTITITGTIDSDEDSEPDNKILGLDRNLFIGVVTGSGLVVFMVLTLCTCGRGKATVLPVSDKRPTRRVS